MVHNNAGSLKALGLKVQEMWAPFLLRERYVSSRFSMLVEEWERNRPSLLKVFHCGESLDLQGIQRVCPVCLRRQWNTTFFFTTEVDWESRRSVFMYLVRRKDFILHADSFMFCCKKKKTLLTGMTRGMLKVLTMSSLKPLWHVEISLSVRSYSHCVSV